MTPLAKFLNLKIEIRSKISARQNPVTIGTVFLRNGVYSSKFIYQAHMTPLAKCLNVKKEIRSKIGTLHNLITTGTLFL